MECEVRFFGAVSTATDGTESARVRFDGSSLEDLLNAVQIRWPKTKDFISGPKRGSVVLLVNEKAVEKSNLEKGLQEGDKISIMPFVAGG
jgi:molybdopterin converting factor small subunit